MHGSLVEKDPVVALSVGAEALAVVAGYDDECPVQKSPLLEVRNQLTEAMVHIGNLTIVSKETCVNNATTNCKPYFKIATDKQENFDITFNWLIIN